MHDQDEYIGINEDVLKTSSEDEDQRRLQDVFKTPSSRRMFAGFDAIQLFLSKQYFCLFSLLITTIISNGTFF